MTDTSGSKRRYSSSSKGSSVPDSPERQAARRVAKSERRAQNKAAYKAQQERKNAAASLHRTPKVPAKKDEPPPAEVLPLSYYATLDHFEEFCRDCLVIVTKQGKRVPFALNSSQRIVLATIRRLIAARVPPRIIVLKARQVGVSTLIEALLFWDCLVRSDRSSLVIAHTLKSSKALFRMSRNFHRALQGDMKQETRIQNVHEVEFDSGSRMQIEVQGDARGYTAQMVHLSEFAYYEQASATLTAVMQTVPLTVDSFAALESTANGVGGIGEAFHKVWQMAVGLSLDTEVPEDEKGWTPIFIPWFRHEEYELPADEKFFHFTADESRLCREHPEITRQKLKWRRWCIKANCQDDEEKFAQEYPATDQEAFLLSGRPAFDADAVKHYTNELNKVVLEHRMPPKSEITSDPPGIGVPEIIVEDRGRLRIFAEPTARHTYIVGADPSEGDPGSDHSPLAVLDEMSMDQVATWYGKAPPDVLAMIAIDLARYYRDALIIGEANNHGLLFHSTLTQVGYPHIYYRLTSPESVAGEVTEKPGYMSTDRSRQNLFDTLRKFVRMKMGKLTCPHMVQQVQTCIYVDDKVQAGVGSEKDLLVAFGLCLMAHRGSMGVELVPHPEDMIRSVATTASLIKEREGAEKADAFVLVETGMSQDAVQDLADAVLAREKAQRKYGLSGMR